MAKLKTIRPESTEQNKSTPTEYGIQRAAKYNNSAMLNETIKAKEGFPARLAYLRGLKGVSAREMSLSLGEGTGYICNIENKYSWPSVEMFFEICEYLDVSPAEFFDYTNEKPQQRRHLAKLFSGLSSENEELLTLLTEKLKERK